MPKLKKCEIRYVASKTLTKKGDNFPTLVWRFFEAGRPVEGWASATKAAFIKEVVRHLHERAVHGEIFSLRIGNKNGQYSDEKTIPRSADPKKSKG